MMKSAYLKSTNSNETLSINALEEFDSKGQSLEVIIEDISNAKIDSSSKVFHQYADFFHFPLIDAISLGEGNTPLIEASDKMNQYLGCNILLKNETVNPTWSFKDRGSWAMMQHISMLGEKTTATVSTGNMGNSTAAYAAKAGIKPLIIVPAHASSDKIKAATLSGAQIFKVDTNNYSDMKNWLNKWAPKNQLRLSSGNSPIRVEGYKTTAFELYDQLEGNIPDYIAIPTSACGHIRGVFKGFKELQQAGIIEHLPKMIIVQAAGNAPLVNTLKAGSTTLIPELNPKTIASAITTGNPLGGQEIIDKAYQYNWLYASVSEEEILKGQTLFAKEGFYVEPATATLINAIKQLSLAGKIKAKDKVVMILTGGGLKDPIVNDAADAAVINVDDDSLEKSLLNFTNIQ